MPEQTTELDLEICLCDAEPRLLRGTGGNFFAYGCAECGLISTPHADLRLALFQWNEYMRKLKAEVAEEARPVEAALQKRIEELEAERRWIPVSERYPGDEAFNRTGVVEIYSKRFGILTAWYERWDSAWVTNLENHRLPSLEGDVTHWRPTDAPPTDAPPTDAPPTD